MIAVGLIRLGIPTRMARIVIQLPTVRHRCFALHLFYLHSA